MSGTNVLLLLLLLSIINISTEYVISNEPRNEIAPLAPRNENASLDEIAPSDAHYYPVHEFELMIHGNSTFLNKVCVHWIDAHQKEAWHDCSINTAGLTATTTPNWSSGYKFSFHFQLNTDHYGPVFWWDGWKGMAFCNNLVIHNVIVGSKSTFTQFTKWQKCNLT
ncbi:17835_t:CDS:2 [Acaulospora morrowiae]|uniref:17835_t:CDS:1 n=1 Tax=Acaulospora morrowiae TaxID=94023 RepID=A0A9N9E710_9GLOM|nr:17835_t:CDS:2 [Acaulospora morrowiae]